MKVLTKNKKLNWKILARHQPYNVSRKRCNLSLNEKLRITLRKGDKMSNKKTEILIKRIHRNKYSLAFYETKN